MDCRCELHLAAERRAIPAAIAFVTAKDVGASVIISSSRKFIFLHLHKTGGGSVTTVLEPFLDDTDLVLHHSFDRLPRRQRLRFIQYRGLAKHSPAIDVMRVIDADLWRDCFKFAIVRNPIDRTISFYNFCSDQHKKRSEFSVRHLAFHTWQGKDDDPLRWPGIRAFQATTSFREFIRHPEALRDTAMLPQFRSLCDARGQLAVDFVGRYEQFNDDLAAIQRKIGLPEIVATPENVTKSQLVSRADVTPDDRQYLKKLFEVDFETFGYQP